MSDFAPPSSATNRKTRVRMNPGRGENPPPAGGGWFQPAWLVLAAVIVSGVFFAPRIWNWLPDLQQRPEYQLRTAEIIVPEIPQWVPRNFVEQVVKQGNLGAERSLLDEQLLPEIAKAFRKHPWVEKVKQLSKAIPARVTVEIVFRRPVAMVEVAKGVLPVDANGVLLPPGDFTAEDVRRYPLILNPGTGQPGTPGQPWNDPQVVGAAKLAGALLPHWNEFQMEAIVLTTREKDTGNEPWSGLFQVRTRGGSRILWGRAPGVVYPGELTAEQKIGRLEECVSRFGGFDQPDGPYEIDIRHFQEITRIRLTAEQSTPQRRQ